MKLTRRQRSLIRIYTEAARRIAQDEDDYTCCCVDTVARRNYSDARALYSDVMDLLSGLSYQQELWRSKDIKQRRVLMLLFTARWVETELS